MRNRKCAGSVAVLGAGSWGTTLANHLAGRGVAVRLWAFEAEVVASIARNRENTIFLPGVRLHRKLDVSGTFAEVLAGAEIALFVTPSHVARTILREARPHLPRQIPVVVASKGIETDSLKTMAGVFAEELDPLEHHLAFLSGPSFARDVSAGLPTAVTVASRDGATSKLVQGTFSAETFRVYTTDDVVGVEIGGALKNVIDAQRT